MVHSYKVQDTAIAVSVWRRVPAPHYIPAGAFLYTPDRRPVLLQILQTCLNSRHPTSNTAKDNTRHSPLKATPWPHKLQYPSRDRWSSKPPVLPGPLSGVSAKPVLIPSV
ncbi:hypothetical protein GWK47_019942 [Chionoecetes opilio]|uniref:Uncharacterized protein n=1 Tax=Chionoecetes opilio TaxID=41210 RepID=A0A8J4XRS6_CHIOP|nr:hypothetical protein GWK47_019942 [Chionoecetes opilio]